METQTLQVEVRKGSGKSAARQLRAQGQLPAVVYGNGIEPRSLVLSPKAFRATLSTEFGRNVILMLQIEGQEEMAIVKELQVDPLTREVLHVDFLKIDPSRPVAVDVPVTTQGRAKGVIKGGTLKPFFRVLPLRCAADKVPPSIVVDVTDLDVNENIKVKDLVLPEGVHVHLAPERSIITVIGERGKAADEEAESDKKGEAAKKGEAKKK